MADNGMKKDKKIGENYLRQTHSLVKTESFGDINIELWRDASGGPYIRMVRGKPDIKTFCLDHFLQFADKVQIMADVVRERVGQI